MLLMGTFKNSLFPATSSASLSSALQSISSCGSSTSSVGVGAVSSLSSCYAICAASSLYKLVAFLALLSLIPSSPPSPTTASMVKEAELQKIFKLRNENDWKSLWHSEKHVRCRDQLLSHMDWACQKDIYRLEKRRFQQNNNVPPQDDKDAVNGDDDPFGDIFVGKSLADAVIKPWNGYIRRKREEKSITDECCSAAGCTWEEYAEYCPAHRRLQTRRTSRRK